MICPICAGTIKDVDEMDYIEGMAKHANCPDPRLKGQVGVERLVGCPRSDQPETTTGSQLAALVARTEVIIDPGSGFICPNCNIKFYHYEDFEEHSCA